VREVTLRFENEGEPVKAFTLEGPGLYPPALKALFGTNPSKQACFNLMHVVESVYQAGFNDAKAQIREALGLRVTAFGDLVVRKE
jgi:hypothetical protein